MAEKADVLIIGAGMSGLSAAYQLARAGVDVLVIDKGFLAGEASGRNPGGIRLLGRDEAEVPLMLEAMKMWAGLGEELGVNIDFRNDGYVWLALTEEEIPLQRDLVARDAAFGIKEVLLSKDDLKSMAPGLAMDQIHGGLYSPGCSFADPFRVALGYHNAAKRLGARFWFETEVTDINVDHGRISDVLTTRGPISVPQVIVAAGPWSQKIGRMAGVTIPMNPLPYQVALTEPVPWRVLPICMFISNKGFFIQSSRGHVYMGDTNVTGNKGSFDKSSDYRFIVERERTYSSLVPAFKSLKYIRSWVGIIDFTPDDNFIFGKVDEVDGMILACGFSGHGFALGPMTGKMLSEVVIDGKTTLPTDAFHLRRFREKGRQKASHFAHQHVEDNPT